MKKRILLQTIFLLTSFNVINQFAKAQIVYTDVNPDKAYKCIKNGCNQTYSLDLNSDGIIDFNFITTALYSSKNGQGYDYSVSIAPLNNNSVTVYDPANSLPLAFAYGATIQPGLTWWVSTTYLWPLRSNSKYCWDGCVPECDGLWASNTDSYLGLKLIVGAQTYYGWARLSVDVPCFGKSAAFTIKDYAYDKTPDHSITTGTKSGARLAALSLSNDVIDNYQLHVYPNPVSNSATVSFSLSHPEKVILKIFDASGRLVNTIFNKELQQGVHQIEWDIKSMNGNDVTPGIYFMQLNTGNYAEIKRLSVIK